MSMLQDLYVFGYSDYARLSAHYAVQSGHFRLRGHLLDREFLQPEDLEQGLIAFEDFPFPDGCKVFSAIGYASMRNRKAVFDRVCHHRERAVNIFSPAAYIDATARFGRNNIVMPGAVIEPNVVIGDNNVIWSNATICHDTEVGNHNFFAANTTVGGQCKVGDLCFFGFSSIVAQHLNIANETLVAAGAFVNSNTEVAGRYQCVPAVLTSRHEHFGICFD